MGLSSTKIHVSLLKQGIPILTLASLQEHKQVSLPLVETEQEVNQAQVADLIIVSLYLGLISVTARGNVGLVPLGLSGS